MSTDQLAGALFAEDFDLDPAAPARETAEEAAQRAAHAAELARVYAEGVRAGIARQEAEAAEATRGLLAACEVQLRAAGEEAARIAGESADAVARVMFKILATLLPASCARMGEAEIAELARQLLPPLAQEPEVTVQIHPRHAIGFDGVLAGLERELRDRVVVRPDETIAPGDLRIVWTDGKAIRSTAEAWDAITGMLEQFGFLDAGTPEAKRFDALLRAPAVSIPEAAKLDVTALEVAPVETAPRETAPRETEGV